MKPNDYIKPWTCIEVHNGKVNCYHLFCDTHRVASACVRNCGKDTERVTVLTEEEALKLYRKLHAIYGV